MPWRVNSSQGGFVRGGNEVGRAEVGYPQFLGAIDILKYFESGIFVLATMTLATWSAGDPAHLPVGGHARRKRPGRPFRTQPTRQKPRSTRRSLLGPLIACGPACRLWPSPQQGNRAGHDDETTERMSAAAAPRQHAPGMLNRGGIPVFNIRLIADAFLGQQCQRAVLRRRVRNGSSSRSPADRH